VQIRDKIHKKFACIQIITISVKGKMKMLEHFRIERVHLCENDLQILPKVTNHKKKLQMK